MFFLSLYLEYRCIVQTNVFVSSYLIQSYFIHISAHRDFFIIGRYNTLTNLLTCLQTLSGVSFLWSLLVFLFTLTCRFTYGLAFVVCVCVAGCRSVARCGTAVVAHSARWRRRHCHRKPDHQISTSCQVWWPTRLPQTKPL